jgi:hypothetical protein
MTADVVTDLAARFRLVGATGDSLYRTVDSIAGAAADAVWPGAERLYAELAAAQPDVRRLVDSCHDAATALEACVTALNQAAGALADAEHAGTDMVAAESRRRLALAEQQAHQRAQDVAQGEADLVWARLAIEGSRLDAATLTLLEHQLHQQTVAAAEAADAAGRAGQQATIAGADAAAAKDRLAAANGLALQADESRVAAMAAVVAALGQTGPAVPSLVQQRTGDQAPAVVA